jgi:DNA-binding winged helix-turn-helix (wHTH) protein/Flp pilus assembly protein TadD
MGVGYALNYEFGNFRLDAANHTLLRDGRPVPLKPKAFDTLLILIENRERFLTNNDLMQMLWPDVFVEEANLTQNIYELRKALGETARSSNYIRNLPKRGYRFTGNVKAVPPGGASESRKEGAIETLAVLPFKALRDEDRDEYLEIGIADALITSLSSIGRIRLRPTSAVRIYTDPLTDPFAVGRELRVDAILDGSIQKAGGQIRVNARLLNIRDGKTMWSGKFDEPYNDIFELQDALSMKVVDALGLPLTGEEEKRISKSYAVADIVHELFLKSCYYWDKWTPEGWRKAIELGQQSTDFDPAHAPSYAMMAASYCALGIYGEMLPRDAFEEAGKLIRKAIELDDGLSKAYEVQGAIMLFYEWNWESAGAVLRKAIEINPSNATARDLHALYLTITGHPEEAIAEIRRALEIDPLSMLVNSDAAYIFYCARQNRMAIEQLRNTLELNPYFAYSHFVLGSVLLSEGRSDEAIEAMIRANDLSGRDPEISPELAYAYAISGKTAEANKLLENLIKRSTSAYVDPYLLALIYVGLDEKDLAFEQLDRAFRERSRELIYLEVKPELDPLRSDPRFADLSRRIGL